MPLTPVILARPTRKLTLEQTPKICHELDLRQAVRAASELHLVHRDDWLVELPRIKKSAFGTRYVDEHVDLKRSIYFAVILAGVIQIVFAQSKKRTPLNRRTRDLIGRLRFRCNVSRYNQRVGNQSLTSGKFASFGTLGRPTAMT